MSREQCVSKAVDLLGLLHRAPRTVGELVTLTGCGKATVTRWLHALCAEDLVADVGARPHADPRGRKARVYAWKHPAGASEA